MTKPETPKSKIYPKIYSHSKLTTFEQCPLKYKYKYIDKIKIPEKSIEALLGFCVHSVLEYLYNEIKANRMPSIDEIITIYNDVWTDNYNENIVIVRENLTSKDYFNKGVEFLITYYRENAPFDDNTLETEKKILLKLDQDGEYTIQGFIDRLAYNLTEKRYEIHDYKTGNFLPNQETIDNDRQLALYSIAIKDIYGHDKEIMLIWHYLAHNKKIHSQRTKDQLEELKKQTLALIKQIESTQKFKPYISRLCDWCEYKKMCPAWDSSNK